MSKNENCLFYKLVNYNQNNIKSSVKFVENLHIGIEIWL